MIITPVMIPDAAVDTYCLHIYGDTYQRFSPQTKIMVQLAAARFEALTTQEKTDG